MIRLRVLGVPRSPPTTFSRYRVGPRGLRLTCPPAHECARREPSTLGLLFRDPARRWNPSRPAEAGHGLRLSWSSSACAPSSSNRPCVHSPSLDPTRRPDQTRPQTRRRSALAEACLRGTGRSLSRGPTVPPASDVPPSWFLTTSTAYSTRPTAGLLHPAADLGVARVSFGAPPRADPTTEVTVPRPGHAPAALAARFVPFKEFPSPAAAPHHCGRCLLAVGTPQGGDASCDTRCRMPQPASPRDLLDSKALLH